MITIIEALARNILETDYKDLDEGVIDNAKKRIIDVVGCLIAGANTPASSMILDLVRQWGGNNEATILVHGDKVPAHHAAMVNSINARAFDYEVSGPYVEGKIIPAHISGTTVPTAMTMAELVGAAGRELITALVVGDDMASRLLAASNHNLDSSWDCTGTANMFGATAIAGRLFGLDKHQLLNAFGIVINQLSGSFQCVWDGVHSFVLHQGLSARNGIFSAELARRGFTGIKDPLLSKFGYFRLYCQNYSPEILTKELGKKFYADVRFKPYPNCGGNHAAIDCTLDIIRNNKIEPEDISDVTLDVTPWARDNFQGQPFEIGEFPQGSACFSFRYNVANVLVRKSSRLEHFTEESVLEPRVIDLARKVKITGTLPPEKGRRAATVEVRMRDGREFSAHVDAPKGDPIEKPLTREEIKEKFRANVAFSQTLTKENTETAVTKLENLETVNNISQIVKCLTI